jgi:hypothetical protein
MGQTTRRRDTHGKQGPAATEPGAPAMAAPDHCIASGPPTAKVECCLSHTKALVVLEPTRRWARRGSGRSASGAAGGFEAARSKEPRRGLKSLASAQAGPKDRKMERQPIE